MLDFFPPPYPNEFHYSIFARYHQRSSNIAYRHTIYELLGSMTAAALTLFPSNLEYLCGQLDKRSVINSESLIQNNTFFPLYKPFLSKQRSELALGYLKGSNQGEQRRAQKGFLRFNSFIGGTFKYCERCLASDRREFGEAYWHRDHQHPGVLVCYKHGTLLLDSGFPLTSTRNRKDLYLLDEETPRVERSFQPTREEAEHLQYIASSVHWLLNNPVRDDSVEVLNKSYDTKLIECGFARVLNSEEVKENGAFKSLLFRSKVTMGFNSCFSKKLLAQLPESLNVAPRSNWVIKFLKDSRKETNPLRHILISRFLQEDICSMFGS